MSRPPRLVFVNRYFYPDHSATAQMLADLAFALARGGWDVSVLTSCARYDDPGARLPRAEMIGAVRIVRVRTPGRGRMAAYLAFAWGVVRGLPPLVAPGDIVIAMTDPPMLSVLVAAVARRARRVTWLQDLYPEVAAALGVPLTGGPIARALRNRSLRNAMANVAIGETMARRVRDQSVPRVHVIPNWADDVAIRPQDASGLRAAWGLGAGDFVVGYSGHLGRAHEGETLLGAAVLLAARRDIRFLMIGGGSAAAALRDRVAALGLTSFVFQPYQPRAALAQSLAVADVHWLSLRPALEGLIVPSKCYGIAAAGRPIVAIVDPAGEIGQMVRRHDCGRVVAPGQSETLARELAALADAPDEVDRLGRAARAMIDAHYGCARAVAQWDALLRGLALRA